MNTDDMNDEQKRRMAGLCCYNCLGLVSTAAFICAISSFAYCDFLTRNVSLTEGVTADEVCTLAGYEGGLEETCQSLLQTHGIGFEGFWITVPVSAFKCVSSLLLHRASHLNIFLSFKSYGRSISKSATPTRCSPRMVR